ncbi:MAG: hypothetical protein Q9164_006726, partial [Protoblastenia rupestris]
MRTLPLLFSWLALSLNPVSPQATEQAPKDPKDPRGPRGDNVPTETGKIVGHQAPNAPQVIEYLGIPYAKPPTGSLRFAAPQKYPVEKSRELVASSYLDRIIAAFGGSIDRNRSEDCLSLNIWSKDTEKKNKPVLVFFYGGRYSIGTSNTPFYNGQYLADAEDVVVVTLNFRMNIFGFSGAPGEAQNVGFLDQRLAVEWVRDNIRGFGGDPKKIILFGQSSGSVAIDYWSYAYAKDPIVSGFIQHSGTAFSFGNNPPDLALKNWYSASSLLGCGSSGDVLPCMRSKNITEIEAVTTQIGRPPTPNPARSSPIFQPTADGITVFENYKALAVSGQFAKLDNNEVGYYKIPAFSQAINLSESQWIQFNNEAFICPIAFEALNRVQNGVLMWWYRYFADWDNTRLYPTSGAYHGVDLHMVFGASKDVTGLPTSAAQRELTATMKRAWASFADNPTSRLEKLGWPRYDEQ